MCAYCGETGFLAFSHARFRPAGSRSPQAEHFFGQIDLAPDNTNSATESCVAVIARTDPNEQESVILLPELDGIHPEIPTETGP